MAALAAAALIAIVLFAALGRFGGGGEQPAASVGGTPASASGPLERATLTVTVLGSGGGVIQVQPGDIACTRSCVHEFDKGTRVTLTADPGTGSAFASWDGACAGSGTCSIVMNDDRALDAKFDRDAPEPPCEQDVAAADDPSCAEEDLDADGADPEAELLDPGADELDPVPAPDCADGKDNDRDGLTDLAQDPDCTAGRSESGSRAAPASTAPSRRAAPKSDCADGKDNDGDGLTDAAQDPNCTDGDTEAG